MQKHVKSGIVHNLLLLVNILSCKRMSKKDIIFEFKKRNIEISRTSVDNYVNILLKNNIDIKSEKYKGKNFYHIPSKTPKCTLDNEAESVFREFKKIIISQKDYLIIKNAVYRFYKFSSCFDKKSASRIANFGYFSNINWFLVNELEKHCFDKDIIEIEYILPSGKSKNLIVHADKLVIQGHSNRLYLSAALGDDFQFSHLPIDRIFMIKRVIRKKACFDIPIKLLKYTVSRNAFELIGLEDNEIIFKKDKNKVTILSPLTDEFSAVQRLLYYCPDVYYISDEKIKSTVLDKLKALERIYEQ